MQQSDTISAIATPQGTAGIGIIRISGETAIGTAEKIFFPVCGKKLSDMESHRAVYGHIRDFQGELVDEAIALVMRSPHSYTKEDVVELQCHGGTMPLRRTLALTYEAGARSAERGEFTKRAFLNGRLDLSQAQAVMDVIQARTRTSLKVAEGHLSGQFSGRIRNLRHDILEQIAHLEASIDFPEDEIEEVVLEHVEKKVVDFINLLKEMLRTARRAYGSHHREAECREVQPAQCPSAGGKGDRHRYPWYHAGQHRGICGYRGGSLAHHRYRGNPKDGGCCGAHRRGAFQKLCGGGVPSSGHFRWFP